MLNMLGMLCQESSHKPLTSFRERDDSPGEFTVMLGTGKKLSVGSGPYEFVNLYVSGRGGQFLFITSHWIHFNSTCEILYITSGERKRYPHLVYFNAPALP